MTSRSRCGAAPRRIGQPAQSPCPPGLPTLAGKNGSRTSSTRCERSTSRRPGPMPPPSSRPYRLVCSGPDGRPDDRPVCGLREGHPGPDDRLAGRHGHSRARRPGVRQPKLRAGRPRANCPRPTPAVLPCIGDFDASGADIEREWVARTDRWAHVERVLLTDDQVREYRLPAAVGKAGEPRWPAFADRHGLDRARPVQWEVEARVSAAGPRCRRRVRRPRCTHRSHRGGETAAGPTQNIPRRMGAQPFAEPLP